MFVGAPLVKTEQDRSVRVDDLPKVIMSGSRPGQPKQPLIPFETPKHIANPNYRPDAFHASPRAAERSRTRKSPFSTHSTIHGSFVFMRVIRSTLSLSGGCICHLNPGLLPKSY